MGVVYFSIIPTFEPSRYCKCWIVCFYDSNTSSVFPIKHSKTVYPCTNKRRQSYRTGLDEGYMMVYGKIWIIKLWRAQALLLYNRSK